MKILSCRAAIYIGAIEGQVRQKRGGKKSLEVLATV